MQTSNLLLKSEFYYPLHVDMDVAYSCLKYVFFKSQSFVYNMMRAHGCENHVLTNFRLGVELVRDAVCFFARYISGL